MFKIVTLAMTCGMLLTSNAMAVTLINETEARLPAPPKAIATRAITRGPEIKVISPDVANDKVTSPFPLRIAFQPKGGSKIDLSSVAVTYLKTPNIELLDRVKSGLTEKGIDLATAEVPVGEHQIRVVVQDNEGRLGSTIINLNVVK